ncbi:MAG: HPr family phosphocarrier protein [Candidatus Aureabacteria bacterium]|nr:HPr family phosphocarrier protein [Candidatus Auribacterota bacterium]
MVKREILVGNKLGLHARPAAMFVQLANRFASEIIVERGNEKVNGKSIMGIMMLAAGKGVKITVTSRGNDAENAVNAIEELFKSKFGED